MKAKCIYDVYENGRQNGIQFGYIPDYAEKYMKLWAKGYSDGRNGKRMTLQEIDNLTKEIYNESH